MGLEMKADGLRKAKLEQILDESAEEIICFTTEK